MSSLIYLRRTLKLLLVLSFQSRFNYGNQIPKEKKSCIRLIELFLWIFMPVPGIFLEFITIIINLKPL